LPSETQESRYAGRLRQAYPIHPEVFDRLYEDWTTIDGFQRTRGVLKLMAKVIHRLWKDDNKDLMIMPGSVPLYDGGSRNELTYYLPAGWDAVLEKDIDGERAETTELEAREPRFGAVNAARRVARTLFLGSAPASVASKTGIRGLDRGRVLLGCLQPGQTSSTYSDALNRLADRLHYLNSSGDKAQDTTRFWFDTRANLRREMEDRKQRFDDVSDVRVKIDAVLKKLGAGGGETFWLAVRGNLGTLADAKAWWQVVEGPLNPIIADATLCGEAAALLPPEPWDGSTWERWADDVKQATGAKGKSLFQPLRLALTGRAHGPELKALLPLIGRTRALARLEGRPA
jgi:hypothetical protein